MPWTDIYIGSVVVVAAACLAAGAYFHLFISNLFWRIRWYFIGQRCFAHTQTLRDSLSASMETPRQ